MPPIAFGDLTPGRTIDLGLGAMHSITAYLRVMIFAFLFGLSMDYEVFMLGRLDTDCGSTR